MRYWILCFILLFIHPSLSGQKKHLPFQADWQFARQGAERWYPASVPGTVHTDLLASKLIADPFFGDQEKAVQWVEKENWIYRGRFRAPSAILKATSATLVFEGLDTHADVFLNGRHLFRANNMFRAWRAAVTPLLKGSDNELVIIFYSAANHDDSLAALSPVKLAGENSRMYSRKAQYHYGWDWGPRLVTCGIWQPIHWETGGEQASIPAAKVKSWEVNLVQQPDSIGRSFYFTRQGKPVFIKGANWIPCESFLPRAKKLDLYRKLLREAKEANINMLRVWGGGVYEDDIFYDLCDQYGIMVWQDFMFAGALYPGDSSFRANVEQEIRYQVNRLRHHPSIVLWCGNNEIEEAWFNWGWQKQFNYGIEDSARLWSAYRSIFHEMIPRILKDLDPGRPYWPSSPSLGWGREQAYKQGDVHYWGVWWGREPVERYREKVGRFNSEYGMQSLPDIATIRAFAGAGDTDTGSVAMKTHQKHPFGYPNIRQYILNRFPEPKGLEDLVYTSQLMQADAMAVAIEAHRRNKPYNMGTLFWQWNDCWPAVSWSAIDYYGRKKAMAYRLKELYAPVMVTAAHQEKGLEVWVVSDSARDFTADVEVDYLDMAGRSLLSKPVRLKDQRIRAGASNHFTITASPEVDVLAGNTAFARIKIRSGSRIIADHFYFPKPPKDMKWLPARIQWKKINEREFDVTTDAVAYGVYIYTDPAVMLSDNYFHLSPGEKKRIRILGKSSGTPTLPQLTFRSLADIRP